MRTRPSAIWWPKGLPRDPSTILTLLVFGALARLQGRGIAEKRETPWMGIEERVNIYATMLWLAVLALGLMRVPCGNGQKR